MTTVEKYRSDYENWLPYRVYFRKTVRYSVSHERFIVPWQLVDEKREKPEEK